MMRDEFRVRMSAGGFSCSDNESGNDDCWRKGNVPDDEYLLALAIHRCLVALTEKQRLRIAVVAKLAYLINDDDCPFGTGVEVVDDAMAEFVKAGMRVHCAWEQFDKAAEDTNKSKTKRPIRKGTKSRKK